jgi:carbamoyltransferase
MNSVANGKIRERTPFEEVYIQPAAGDNGTALGSAVYVWNHLLGRPRRFVMRHGYWGTAFGKDDIRRALSRVKDELKSQRCVVREMDSEDHLCGWAAFRRLRGRLVPGSHGMGCSRLR